MNYVFVADDRARLEAAEELLDDGTQRLLDRLGLAEGWRCLEVGAGGGSIALWLSERVGPRGHVLATDLDTRSLEQIARSNLEAKQHDVVRDDLDEERFDLVHARLLLEHLPERERVLRKLVRALRPGGRVMIESVDYVSAVPVSDLGADEHARSQAVRLEAFARAGVDHNFGRHLPALLTAVGLEDVENDGRAWVMQGGSAGARWFKHSLAHLRERLIGTGKLTSAEVDRMLELFDDPGWSALSPIILAAWGRRP
jgi:2-polyprenyl-3-methyl-5-hydroxy-6-metoxy-1,4-benzoquinol methylase